MILVIVVLARRVFKLLISEAVYHLSDSLEYKVALSELSLYKICEALLVKIMESHTVNGSIESGAAAYSLGRASEFLQYNPAVIAANSRKYAYYGILSHGFYIQ